MRIRRPRGLSKVQVAVGLAVGVLSGFYIYQPFFAKQQRSANLKEAEKESQSQRVSN